LTEPTKRTLDFTTKCKTGAVREKIALVKTADLFYATRHIQETGNEDYKKACRDAIHAGLGTVIVFPVVKKPEAVVAD
jgi:hypothetical protein